MGIRGSGRDDERRQVFSQILSAVGHAHAAGLVHRDLKPSNVLVRDVDGKPMAKVADFGVAKILGSDKLRTATSAKMGTLAYMSPEQLRSPKDADHRSDLYSIGVMLYEAMTGQIPFDADSEFELMRKVIEDAPADPLRTMRGCDPALAAVVRQALEKDPVNRFGSAGHMAGLLGSADSHHRLGEAGRVFDHGTGPTELKELLDDPGGLHRANRQAQERREEGKL
jgi:serine/threonine protein kinase